MGGKGKVSCASHPYTEWNKDRQCGKWWTLEGSEGGWRWRVRYELTACTDGGESSNLKNQYQSISSSVPYPDDQRRCGTLERPRCEQRVSPYLNRWGGVPRWPAECIGCANLDCCGPSIYLDPRPIVASIPRSPPLQEMRMLETMRMVPGLCRRDRHCWLRVLQ